jgi:hypothetical protein
VSHKPQGIGPNRVNFFFRPPRPFITFSRWKARPQELRRKIARPATVKEGAVFKADRTPPLAVVKDIRALAAKGKNLPVGIRNIRENILTKKNMQKL